MPVTTTDGKTLGQLRREIGKQQREIDRLTSLLDGKVKECEALKVEAGKQIDEHSQRRVAAERMASDLRLELDNLTDQCDDLRAAVRAPGAPQVQITISAAAADLDELARHGLVPQGPDVRVATGPYA